MVVCHPHFLLTENYALSLIESNLIGMNQIESMTMSHVTERVNSVECWPAASNKFSHVHNSIDMTTTLAPLYL